MGPFYLNLRAKKMPNEKKIKVFYISSLKTCRKNQKNICGEKCNSPVAKWAN
jgi:hypothetical protein